MSRPKLYVKFPALAGEYRPLGEEEFRRATADEIGATVQALVTGQLDVRVGRIAISSGSERQPFVIGRDCAVTVDGEPMQVGGRLKSVSLRIESDKAVKVVLEVNP